MIKSMAVPSEFPSVKEADFVSMLFPLYSNSDLVGLLLYCTPLGSVGTKLFSTELYS